ncbi:unnamed protein product [Protopolystoma xenopodis]|uniref:Uncharacterized protein n=1 Tax=Protopolystoma xenopodis TaxID=117903 RepID=A0A448XDA7_9PLAT|nr:unnamed protein product [Protopolystoma xenopodis]
MKSKNESNSAFYRARRPSPLSSDFMNINDPNQSITKHHSIRGIQSKDSSSGLQSSKRKFSFNKDPERRQAHMEKLLQAERRRSFTTVGSLLQRPCLPSSGQQGKEGDEIVYPASDQVKHRWRRLIACRNPVSGGQKRLPMTSWCNTERLSPNLTPVDNSNPNSTAENSVNCLDGDSSDTEPGNQVEETFPMQAVRQPFFEISSLISPGNHVFLDDRLGNPSTGTIADNCIEEPFDLDQLHSPSIEELAQIAMGFSSPVELALENLSEEDPLSGSRDDTESFSDSLLEAGWPQSMRAADELANGCIVSDQVTSIAASPLVGQIGEESESYTSLNRSSPIDNLEIYFHPSLCANPTISTATPSFAHSNSLFPSASSSSSSSSSTSPLAFSIASTTPLIVPAQQAQDTASPDGLCELR